MSTNRTTKLKAAVATASLGLILCGGGHSWAKGPLDGEIAALYERAIAPIFIRENLCRSVQDCGELRNFLCTSWDSLSCDLYGIADKKLVKEVLLVMLSSGLKISHFRVWRSKRDDKSLFEKPILEFIDHTGGK